MFWLRRTVMHVEHLKAGVQWWFSFRGIKFQDFWET